jgi:CRISPR/Cas system-associated exonuclease Cas4 (RecB family)
MTAQEWIELIEARSAAYYEEKRRVSPQVNIRASQIGSPACQIFHSIVNWRYRKPFGQRVIERMEDGNLHERSVIDWLSAIGFDALGSQMDGCIEYYGKPIITMRLDTILNDRSTRERVLAEIKSMVGFMYDKVNTVDDLLQSRWYAPYVFQVQAYLEGFKNQIQQKDFALLILKNKSNSAKKIISIPRDDEMIMKLKQKAHDIKQAIDGTAKYKEVWLEANRANNGDCVECDYKVVCCPTINADAIELELDADWTLAEMLKARETVNAASKEFDRIDKKVKECLQKTKPFKRALVGDFVIERKEGETTKYEYPEDVKKQFAKKVPRISFEIKAIGTDDEEE